MTFHHNNPMVEIKKINIKLHYIKYFEGVGTTSNKTTI